MNTTNASSKHEVVVPNNFNLDDLPVRVGHLTIRRGDAEAFKAMLRDVARSKRRGIPPEWPAPQSDQPTVT